MPDAVEPYTNFVHQIESKKESSERHNIGKMENERAKHWNFQRRHAAII